MMVEEQRWRAVQDRTRTADGAFVYAVRTTQIYCRPSCPSRKPLRGNVEFFVLPEAAERAGYRACLRCPRMARPLWVLWPRGSAPAPSICSASSSVISAFRRANMPMLAGSPG